jgi:hypothetical protein
MYAWWMHRRLVVAMTQGLDTAQMREWLGAGLCSCHQPTLDGDLCLLFRKLVVSWYMLRKLFPSFIQ